MRMICSSHALAPFELAILAAACLMAVMGNATASALDAEPPIGPDGEWLFDQLHGASAPHLLRQGPTQRPEWDPDSSGYDAIHVTLALEPSFADSTISGEVEWTVLVTAETLGALELDLSQNMEATAVALDGSPVTFTHESDHLRILLGAPAALGDSLRINVSYHGRPLGAYHDGFSFDEHAGVPIAFTNCEPVGARTWWPCKDRPDDKFTADCAFTVPDTMIATSSGQLQDVVPIPGARLQYRWHESYPVTTYLVSLTATNFTSFHDSYHAQDGSEMPLDFFAYPEDLERAMTDWAFTAQAVSWLAETFREYPFVSEKYGMVEYPWIGAMEHQTLSSMGEYFLDLDHPSDWVVVHELSHQWWGNWVTCGTWRDIWLNEGFATYCEALWAEHLAGPDSLRFQMERFRRDEFDGSVYDPDYIFNATVYRKGAWVLHMLRHVVGDETFFDALLAYGEGHAYDNAITPDLEAAMAAAWGHPLDWFFDEWVYGEGQPRYRVQWYPQAIEADGTTQVEVTILQETTGPQYFKMPLDARFTLRNGGDFNVVLWDSLPEQSFLVETPAPPESLDIDPDDWVLGRVLYVADPLDVPAASREVDLSMLRLAPPRPNPMTSTTVISVLALGSTPAEGASSPAGVTAGLRLRLFDPQGRCVRVLGPIGGVAGAGSFVWDGRDELGRDAAAGIYYAGLAGASSPRVAILLVR